MLSNNPTSIGTSALRNSSLLIGVLLILVFVSVSLLGLERILEVARFSPLRCPLKLLGFSCPTCGLGHSLLAAFNGDWEMSFRHHPLGMVVFGFVLVFSAVGVIFPKQLQLFIRRLPQRMSPQWVLSIVLLYVAWHLSRVLGTI